MARIRTRTASASVKLDPIGGIDRRGVVYDTVNLRPGSDGAPTRRCGFRLALTLDAPIRGIWSGSFLGEETVFAVAGAVLYRLDPAAGASAALGEVAAGTGKVALFLWRGKLCCIDGVGIYLWDGEALTEAEPYAPMVARERHPLDMYAIDEPINLLGRRARFSFRGTGSNSSFYFGCQIESVQAVYNASSGMQLMNNAFRLNQSSDGNSYLTLYDMPASGIVILVQATLAAKYYDYARIAACTNAVVYGGSCDDRILCWGGGGEAEMFCSRPVSKLALEESRLWGNVSGEMYFPQDCNFHVGDGRYPLRTACRHHDRLLIFTAGDTWMADFSATLDAQMPVVPINSGVGCGSVDGAALCGNDPLTVAEGGIWRWTSSALRRDECSAECISGGLAGLLPAGFSARAVAYSCRRRGEVWFADPGDDAGRVFIYDVEKARWTVFTGVYAEALFGWRGDVAFCRGSSFFCFDEAETVDRDAPGAHEIEAGLSLRGIVFGRGEALRHTTRAELVVRGMHPAITLTLETDRGRRRTVVIPAGGKDGVDSYYGMPLRSGRFRTLALSLSAIGGGAYSLRALTLVAEPEE